MLSVSDWKKLPFLGKFRPKNCNCQFKLKMVLFEFEDEQFEYEEFNSDIKFFLFSIGNIIFWGKFVPKIKIFEAEI